MKDHEGMVEPKTCEKKLPGGIPWCHARGSFFYMKRDRQHTWRAIIFWDFKILSLTNHEGVFCFVS